ncbi:hypothetical protein L210DRAFT_3566284 [Boletus edulis BED1]|uniref:Uncharacterized protein n=1 Tax=Boletus edulis BED1 TaxID=1328754 RepID=A0AAD4BFI2_BOLED|nr:hypothetical protein L210DRAFT_3566284 [Boletus edulis BED1]
MLVQLGSMVLVIHAERAFKQFTGRKVSTCGVGLDDGMPCFMGKYDDRCFVRGVWAF